MASLKNDFRSKNASEAKLTAATTTVVTNKPAPSSSPIAMLKVFDVTAANVDETSGAPLPSARIVKPYCRVKVKIFFF